jgi:hypothetical protein
VQQDGRHGRLQVPVLARVHGAAELALAERLRDVGHVFRRGAGSCEALNQAVGQEGRRVVVEEELVQ